MSPGLRVDIVNQLELLSDWNQDCLDLDLAYFLVTWYSSIASYGWNQGYLDPVHFLISSEASYFIGYIYFYLSIIYHLLYT
jgi:hypothetical protein